MKNFTGLFCVFCLFFLSSQTYGQYRSKYDTCRTSYLLVKTNLITPLGLDGRSSIELGLEKSLFRSFSFSLNGGYQLFYRKEDVDTAFIQPRGFKVNAELRFYYQDFLHLHGFFRPTGMYGGIQFFYRDYEYNRSILFENKYDTSGTVFKDNIGVRNTCYGVNFTGGFQKIVRSWLVMDFYWGVGVMNRTISTVNMTYDTTRGDEHLTARHPNTSSIKYVFPHQGGTRINFTAGIRVGIFIYRKRK